MTGADFCKAAGFRIQGILHVGANHAQEHADYEAATAGPIVYVEAIPDLCEKIKVIISPEKDQHVIQAVCDEVSGKPVTFNIASNKGASSSMLQLGRHAELYEHVTYVDTFETKTTTLDAALTSLPCRASLNLLVLDVQGAELRVLKGAEAALTRINALYVEVSEVPLYEGGCTFEEVYDFLTDRGFRLRNLAISKRKLGDAFFVKS